MMSAIQVKCPHCHAEGQMTLPPMASIILAGCPQCQEAVVIFLGRAFPLSKEILMNGTVEEKREHMLSTLTEVLAKGVDELLAQDALVAGMSAEPAYEEVAEEPGFEGFAVPIDTIRQCFSSSQPTQSAVDLLSLYLRYLIGGQFFHGHLYALAAQLRYSWPLVGIGFFTLIQILCAIMVRAMVYAKSCGADRIEKRAMCHAIRYFDQEYYELPFIGALL